MEGNEFSFGQAQEAAAPAEKAVNLKSVVEELTPAVKTSADREDLSPEDNTEEDEKSKSKSDNLLDKKFKIKVNGVEESKPLREIIKDYQKFQAADRRFQEAAELRKQVEQRSEELTAIEKSHETLVNYLTSVRSSPEKLWELAEELGVNVDDLAHEYVLKKMEYSMLDPREREFQDQRKQFEREKQELEKYRSQQQAEREKAQYSTAQNEVEEEMLAYFKANNIPKPDLPVLTQAVNFMLGAMDSGKTLTFAQAYERAKNQLYPEDLRARYLDEAIKSGRLTEEQKRLLRQSDLKAQVPTRPTAKVISRPQNNTPTQSGKSINSWFDEMDSKFGSKRR
jgi:hypothetical protein